MRTTPRQQRQSSIDRDDDDFEDDDYEDEEFDEFGCRNSIEIGFGLSSDSAGKQSLSATRSPLKQDSARETGAGGRPSFRMQEEVYDIAQHFLRLEAAADVIECDRGVLVDESSSTLPERENIRVRSFRLTEEIGQEDEQ